MDCLIRLINDTTKPFSDCFCSISISCLQNVSLNTPMSVFFSAIMSSFDTPRDVAKKRQFTNTHTHTHTERKMETTQPVHQAITGRAARRFSAITSGRRITAVHGHGIFLLLSILPPFFVAFARVLAGACWLPSAGTSECTSFGLWHGESCDAAVPTVVWHSSQARCYRLPCVFLRGPNTKCSAKWGKRWNNIKKLYGSLAALTVGRVFGPYNMVSGFDIRILLHLAQFLYPSLYLPIRARFKENLRAPLLPLPIHFERLVNH